MVEAAFIASFREEVCQRLEPMMKRGRADIYADILEAVIRHGGAPITKVAYASGLPLDRARKILNLLVSYGLIKEERGERPRFNATRRGLEFLDAYRKMKVFLTIISGESL